MNFESQRNPATYALHYIFFAVGSESMQKLVKTKLTFEPYIVIQGDIRVLSTDNTDVQLLEAADIVLSVNDEKVLKFTRNFVMAFNEEDYGDIVERLVLAGVLHIPLPLSYLLTMFEELRSEEVAVIREAYAMGIMPLEYPTRFAVNPSENLVAAETAVWAQAIQINSNIRTIRTQIERARETCSASKRVHAVKCVLQMREEKAKAEAKAPKRLS